MRKYSKSYRLVEQQLKELDLFIGGTWRKSILSTPQKYFANNQNLFIKILWVAVYTCLDSYFVDIFDNLQDCMSTHLLSANTPNSLIIRDKDNKLGWLQIIGILKIDTANPLIYNHTQVKNSWDQRNNIIHRNAIPAGKTLLDLKQEIVVLIKYLKSIDKKIVGDYMCYYSQLT